jgi:hypothetical protein
MLLDSERHSEDAAIGEPGLEGSRAPDSEDSYEPLLQQDCRRPARDSVSPAGRAPRLGWLPWGGVPPGAASPGQEPTSPP